MLSAAQTQENEIRALYMHADEYLGEPLDVGIVSVRIDSILTLSHAD